MRWGLLWLVLTAAGCGDDSAPPSDGGEPDAVAATCDSDLVLDTGAPDGHAEPFGAGPGEARAGRLADGVWPADPLDLSTAQPGDFVLANDRIAVLIEDVGHSDVIDPWGGRPVGIARVAGGAPVERGDFTELILLIERFTVATETVGVLSDGTDGGPAVVRATGPLSPLPFFDPLARTLLPGDLSDITVAIDWSLAPDAEQVQVSLRLLSSRTAPIMIRTPLVFLFQDDRMPQWVPESGFGPVGAESPYVAYVDDDAASFAWADAAVSLAPFIELSGASIFQHGRFTIAPCAATDHPFGELTVGGPGLDGLLQVIAAQGGQALRTIGGVVAEADGRPAEGVRVHAQSADGVYRTRDLTGVDGRYELHVPEGEGASLTAWRRGDALGGPLEVPAATATQDITLAATGAIHVTARDAASSTPLPVRVQVIPTGELPEVPRHYGEWLIPAGRLHVEYPIDGDVTMRVPPGEHTVVVSRGFEYEIVTATVNVAADATVDVAADLPRVVDTTSVMCGDFHVHTHRSMDTKDPTRLKVMTAIADGVEIPVRSDHEWIADFEPMIAELDVGDWAYGVGSLELTTTSWGHFGVFPLDPDAGQANGGAPVWTDLSTPEVLDGLRARAGAHGAPVVIINHPRRFGGLMGEGAYFDRVGYDPATGMVMHADLWDERFGLVEVFNDDTFLGSLEEVEDWFSFLRAGRRVFAVGSSDSHEVADVPVGYPRTCVEVGVDTAAELRALGAGAVRDALSMGHATISGGIYVEAAVGTAGPGDDVTGVGAQATVSVTVRAASWIDVDELRVYVDGALAETVPIDDTTTDPMDATVRLRADVLVDVSDGALGSFVVVTASGDTDLSPVFPGRLPFGVTNPIFLTR